jgi:hypothetical protein
MPGHGLSRLIKLKYILAIRTEEEEEEEEEEEDTFSSQCLAYTLCKVTMHLLTCIIHYTHTHTRTHTHTHMCVCVCVCVCVYSM